MLIRLWLPVLLPGERARPPRVKRAANAGPSRKCIIFQYSTGKGEDHPSLSLARLLHIVRPRGNRTLDFSEKPKRSRGSLAPVFNCDYLIDSPRELCSALLWTRAGSRSLFLVLRHGRCGLDSGSDCFFYSLISPFYIMYSVL